MGWKGEQKWDQNLGNTHSPRVTALCLWLWPGLPPGTRLTQAPREKRAYFSGLRIRKPGQPEKSENEGRVCRKEMAGKGAPSVWIKSAQVSDPGRNMREASWKQPSQWKPCLPLSSHTSGTVRSLSLTTFIQCHIKSTPIFAGSYQNPETTPPNIQNAKNTIKNFSG